ncbi:MAG: histidine--tRNA ligase [Candidatus Nanopelagicaceae bacterium]|nr:histidine--tRNA ligase [Candidatus Nanopelagicaceae bacterium]
MSGDFQAPKGVSEYFPPRSGIFEKVVRKLEQVSLAANYHLIELPVFEDTQLFTRGVGESTDVVTKEMYTFEDRAGRSLTLRPEGTAGVIRSIIEHGLDRGQLPVKLYYRGPFFRAERPQAGRYRQFYQFGIEAVGLDDPYLDAEVISIAHRGFLSLGLKNFDLQITSLGDEESRSKHRVEFLKFLSTLDLDGETLEKVKKNPLRIFDDKRSEIQAQLKGAPVLLDFLTAESSMKFAAVKGALTELGIPFVVNTTMVRGLDYYTGTAFEFVHKGLGAQASIGGGGRYDRLMRTLGGQDLSGIGFGLGIDRIILALESEGLVDSSNENSKLNGGYLDLFIIPIGDAAKLRAINLIENVRKSGFVADMGFGDRSLKGAMKAADKLSARHVLVLGDAELQSGQGRLKRMSDGVEESITLDSIVATLKNSL